MELHALKTKIVELEYDYECIHKILYFCSDARENERQLKEIREDLDNIVLPYIYTFAKTFYKSILSRKLINRCVSLKIKVTDDIFESERVHN